MSKPAVVEISISDLSDLPEFQAMLASARTEVWFARAERLLESALEAMRDELIDEVFSASSAATVCLRIALGEMPEDELEGYPFPGEPEDESGCICPPDLLDRGGFKGGCPVHG